MSIEAIERIQVEARIPAKVEQLKSVYNARSIVSDPGERCPMLGNMAVPCRKGNGLIDVGLSTVYCPDSSRSGVLKVIKL